MFPASLLQGGSTSPNLQGSSPQLQASPSSGFGLQPAPLNSTIYLQPTTTPSRGQTLVPSGGGGSPSPGTTTGGNTGPSLAQQQAAAAAAAQAAALAKAQANYNSTKAGDMATLAGQEKSGASDYNAYIDAAFNQPGGFSGLQKDINTAGIQNELSRDQGLQGVRDMVNNGVQGAGVMLDNANSGTSSAAEAVARAYGIQGRQQASHVGNQYAQGQATIAANQDKLNTNINSFTGTQAPAHKGDIINQIVSNAQFMLNNLNALAQSANITDLPNLQQQIDQVKAEATSALSAYDSQLGANVAANQPTSQAANQAEASQRFSQGVAPAQSFDFTNTAPAQFQNTGPSASSLPIFIAPSNKNNLPITA